jgi:hypothetical protein
MVLFGVPILLVIALSILDVFLIMLLIGVFIIVVLCSVFLVQLLKPFTSVQMLPGLALLPVMFISVQEIFIVFIIFESVSDSLLLLLVWISHLLTGTRLAVFPILICFLVVEVTSGRVSKDKLVIPGTLLWIS